ncbi:MAG: hypothetical protein A2X32_06335 [Elusimicrobia bacterium GWC2_64_44]|nr:MAG: hypothetical protein A2X32_06335 [Elusimicrobia bacterium GWC2_64_44]
MKHTFAVALLFACAVTLAAQAPAEKPKPAPEKKPAAAAPAAAPAPAPQPEQPAAKKPAPAKAATKPAEEPEEAMVMIDDRPEPEGRQSAAGEGAERPAGALGLPTSYGQCKGTLTEGGRSILVFENPEDGEITFVQVLFAKTGGGVSWRLVDSIKRYGSEAISGGSDADYN